ncbi:MAG: hypothetical protein QOF49_1993, partial [Chloroflexota bacterium]|nr:hypothetical protein [Chloroflexota bacterium]
AVTAHTRERMARPNTRDTIVMVNQTMHEAGAGSDNTTFGDGRPTPRKAFGRRRESRARRRGR